MRQLGFRQYPFLSSQAERILVCESGLDAWSGASCFYPDTVCLLTGYDTLDFTKTPIYLSIRSADKKNIKVYEIRPTVHQVDPDLFTWEEIFGGFDNQEETEQRVLEQNGDFVMMVSNGFELSVYRSEEGEEWSSPVAPIGLPTGTKVRQMISDGQTLYYAQDHTIYTSDDAVTWTPNVVAEEVVTMLLYWNGLAWVLTQKEGQYELGYFHNGELTLSGLQPRDEFPISDFSLSTKWHLEYSEHPQPDGQYRLEEFSIDRPKVSGMTGMSVVWYNNQMLLFGGVDDQMSYFGRDILVSTNEGMTWTKADTLKNRLPEVYQARQKQSAIVRGNDIYLFGGQDQTSSYSDVYRGRLNSIDWK